MSMLWTHPCAGISVPIRRQQRGDRTEELDPCGRDVDGRHAQVLLRVDTRLPIQTRRAHRPQRAGVTRRAQTAASATAVQELRVVHVQYHPRGARSANERRPLRRDQELEIRSTVVSFTFSRAGARVNAQSD